MQLTFDLQPGDDALFIDESTEQIERIEQGLLDLERGSADPQLVNEVFRAAHTLKGSAATIGHRRMAGLTHAMEDIFGALRSGQLPSVRPFAEVLLASVDVLRALLAEVSAGETLTDAPEGLTTELRRLLEIETAVATAGITPAPHQAPVIASQQATAGGNGQAIVAAPPTEIGDMAILVRRLIGALPPSDDARSIICCRVDPTSDWQAVRMLQVVIEAEESGRLIGTAPSRQQIEAGHPGADLALVLRGFPDSLADVEARMAAVDDILALDVEVLADHEPADNGEASSGPASSADRRTVDLGPEARGIAGDEKTVIAGERLKAAQQTIRIDVARLDELMNLVGELVVQKTRFQRHAQELIVRLGDDQIARSADQDSQQFARIAGQIQDQVTGLRMLPIETVFNRFPRVVRDVAAKLGKKVELVVEGKETELDRSVLEEVGDPLAHLVRNALDHGIESPDERLALGKPAEGRLRLSARHADGQIVIAIEDDGRGMDPAVLRAAGVTKGILTQEAADAISDEEAFRLIFAPGFSTARKVTDVSGRGVGMDVVRTNIERLGGRVDVQSTVGQGTVVSLSLPLTLAIIGALLTRSGARMCALPLTGVVETLRVEMSDLSRIRGHYVITLRGRVVPVEVLDNALGDDPRLLSANDRGFINLVVVRSRDAEIALAVDEFVGQHEIVLKSLNAFTGSLHGIAGATVMADGSVGLVVDIPGLLRAHLAGADAQHGALTSRRVA